MSFDLKSREEASNLLVNTVLSNYNLFKSHTFSKTLQLPYMATGPGMGKTRFGKEALNILIEHFSKQSNPIEKEIDSILKRKFLSLSISLSSHFFF